MARGCEMIECTDDGARRSWNLVSAAISQHHLSPKPLKPDLLCCLTEVGLDVEAGLSLLPLGTNIFYVLQVQWNGDSVLEAPRLPSAASPDIWREYCQLGSVVPLSQLEKRSCWQSFNTQATLHPNQIQIQLSSNSQQMWTLQWRSEGMKQQRKIPELKR